MINYIKVQSFEHLDELLKQGYTEFSSRYGILSCSCHIRFTRDPDFPYWALNYVDGSDDQFTRQELQKYFNAIPRGCFYAER